MRIIAGEIFDRDRDLLQKMLREKFAQFAQRLRIVDGEFYAHFQPVPVSALDIAQLGITLGCGDSLRGANGYGDP